MAQTIEDIAPLVRKVVGEKTSDHSLFDDAYQEALVAAWQRLEQGHSRQIAIYKAKQRATDILRGNRMLGSQDEHGGRPVTEKHTTSLTRHSSDSDAEEYVYEPADTSDADELDRRADWEVLKPALVALTERQREVVYLHFWDGMNNTQIGRELGISHQAASQNLKKALERLRLETRLN